MKDSTFEYEARHRSSSQPGLEGRATRLRASNTYPRTFSFLLLPGASMLSFTAAIEPLRMARKLDTKAAYSWQAVSLDGEPVAFSNGMFMTVDGALDATRPVDFALIAAGGAVGRDMQKQAAQWIRSRHRHGACVGSVGGGAEVLAQTGLLTDRDFTLHWEDRPGFVERFPLLSPKERLFCWDRDMFTCAGGAAATDMMLHLIAQDFGRGFSLAVADLCVHYGQRSGQERPQSSISATLGSRNPHLIMAARLMSENLEEPIRLDVLADLAGVSRRQMERLFRSHTDRSPAEYYRDLRLGLGRQLLRDTDDRIIDIATACGFSNATTFSRSFQRKFGVGPVQSTGARA
ncbi:HTH-type transcriptional regulator CdhR [Falsiruegeria litorea R37]|uniref:HTH-type transcriptional regulator CdhR n=1 Tax=Falsiruegeria litorea R37 TaxID=1200284 RepID=A0A1Y5TV20_9RHOB|nr:GlxA family transcriptional regulator [Falsiruegeria litorea]SLN73378.1 HTH-type transcriptional regulator CdhR [Falsiruegeria litorea R37]